jgi:hypothetical protein
MSRSFEAAARLTRWWVRCYTCWWVRCYTWRLAADVGADRQAEIDSDLWEHQHDATTAGRRPIEAALEVVGRLVLGVPADLSWRYAQRGLLTELADVGALARKGGATIMTAVRKTWWLVPAGLLAVRHLACWSSHPSRSGRLLGLRVRGRPAARHDGLCRGAAASDQLGPSATGPATNPSDIYRRLRG